MDESRGPCNSYQGKSKNACWRNHKVPLPINTQTWNNWKSTWTNWRRNNQHSVTYTQFELWLFDQPENLLPYPEEGQSERQNLKRYFSRHASYCWNVASCLVVRNLVVRNNDLKSDLETARLLTTTQFKFQSVKALVEESYKLVIERILQLPLTKSAVDLSYASLVRRTCHQREIWQACSWWPCWFAASHGSL